MSPEWSGLSQLGRQLLCRKQSDHLGTKHVPVDVVLSFLVPCVHQASGAGMGRAHSSYFTDAEAEAHGGGKAPGLEFIRPWPPSLEGAGEEVWGRSGSGITGPPGVGLALWERMG